MDVLIQAYLGEKNPPANKQKAPKFLSFEKSRSFNTCQKCTGNSITPCLCSNYLIPNLTSLAQIKHLHFIHAISSHFFPSFHISNTQCDYTTFSFTYFFQQEHFPVSVFQSQFFHQISFICATACFTVLIITACLFYFPVLSWMPCPIANQASSCFPPTTPYLKMLVFTVLVPDHLLCIYQYCYLHPSCISSYPSIHPSSLDIPLYE